jgi:cytochrome c553
MRKFAWLLAGALLPLGARAADAPGPDWAFLIPDPNAPAPAAAPAAAPTPQAGVPPLVAAGKGQEVRACDTCHTPSGMGQPESSSLRGLNPEYFVRQMEAFKSGARGGPRADAMAGYAKNMADAEIKDVAAYYAGLKPMRWTNVSESNVAPKTIVGRNSQRMRLEGAATEPVGKRIIEFAANPAALRQTAEPAFTAIVPPGALNAGRNIATTGGGKTEACVGCHGDKLLGEDDIPNLAGRSPVYIARQLYSFKNGLRKGGNADTMKDIVSKLNDDDIIAVASYIATLDPS